MKCVNCGAEVVGSTCEYCGTHYDGRNVIGVFESNDYSGILKVGDVEYNVYIGEIEINTLYCDVGRDENGRMTNPVVAKKRRFTLVEL